MNRLGTQQSPYLRESSHQPVDWHPWGAAAFALAKKENKPILLDIGASWCHWCHVMDRENYDNFETADFINTHFVSIKVDRDERPDIDRRYQEAVASLTGQGGWPLTVFLTPDGTPFFGGTYFPPTPRYGMPSFREVLAQVLEHCKGSLHEAGEAGAHVIAHMKQRSADRTGGDGVTADHLISYTRGVLTVSDDTNGGFGFAPKFPNAETLLFLIQRHRRTNDPKTLSVIEKALLGMAAGGFHDHVGGGFHRYSTDEKWRVPHFEKMLLDNALLLRCYAHAYGLTGKNQYKQVAQNVLSWLLEEMEDPAGGFYSSQDADFEGEEGKYFGWSEEELKESIDPGHHTAFTECFGLESFEHGTRKALFQKKSPEEAARDLHEKPEFIASAITESLMALRTARMKRGSTPTDTTIYTNWNCHAAIACLEAGMILDNDRATESGLRTLRTIQSNLMINGLAIHRAGQNQPLFSEDSAALCMALITAYESTLDNRYLIDSKEIAERVLETFGSDEEPIADCDEPVLGVSQKIFFDYSQPATNPLFASCLIKIALYLQEDSFFKRAERILGRMADEAAQTIPHASTYWSTCDLLINGIESVVIIGQDAMDMITAYHRSTAPYRAIIVDTQGSHPLSNGKKTIDGKTTAYVCTQSSCSAPITSAQELLKKLNS